MTIREIRAKRAEISKELDELLGEDTLTEDQEARYKELDEEYDKLTKDIERREKQESRKTDLAASTDDPNKIDVDDGFRNVNVGADREEQKPFTELREQLQAIVDFAVHGRFDKRLGRLAAYNDDNFNPIRSNAEIRAAGSGSIEATGAYGGFLLETEVADGLLGRTYDNNQVISRCTRRTLTSNATSIELKGVDESSRATGSRFGGVRAYWAGELDQMTSSRPKFYKVKLTPEKLTGLYFASDEILQDSGILAAEVNDMFEEEFAFTIQDAVVEGDGSGKPLGAVNSGCKVEVSAVSGQGSTTFIYENVTNMWARMWAPSRKNAVWFINQDTEPQLYTMSLPVGTGGAPVYLPPNGAADAPFGRLFGRPVIPIEQCSTLGTAGDILLADFSQYYIVDKGGINGASSIHLKFDFNQTTIRWIYRVDGRPKWKDALTPFKGSNTLSPIVTLSSTRT